MTVYIVTSGNYSDYFIDKVFLEKEKAEKYVKYQGEARIEEYDTSDDSISITSGYYEVEVKARLQKQYDGSYTTSIINCNTQLIVAEYDSYIDGIEDTFDKGSYLLTFYYYFSEANMTEETAKEKSIKLVYDKCSEISYQLSDGVLVKNILKAMNHKE